MGLLRHGEDHRVVRSRHGHELLRRISVSSMLASTPHGGKNKIGRIDMQQIDDDDDDDDE